MKFTINQIWFLHFILTDENHQIIKWKKKQQNIPTLFFCHFKQDRIHLRVPTERNGSHESVSRAIACLTPQRTGRAGTHSRTLHSSFFYFPPSATSSIDFHVNVRVMPGGSTVVTPARPSNESSLFPLLYRCNCNNFVCTADELQHPVANRKKALHFRLERYQTHTHTYTRTHSKGIKGICASKICAARTTKVPPWQWTSVTLI